MNWLKSYTVVDKVEALREPVVGDASYLITVRSKKRFTVTEKVEQFIGDGHLSWRSFPSAELTSLTLDIWLQDHFAEWRWAKEYRKHLREAA